MRVEKMNVKVNQSPSQTPQKQTSNQTNPPQGASLQPQNLNSAINMPEEIEKLYNMLLQFQQMRNQNQNNKNNVYIVKSGMKASIIAIRAEQALLLNKSIVLSGLGYAIVPLIDAIMLVKKDLTRMAINVNIVIELFEREVFSQSSQKKVVISGLKITLSI